MTSTDWRSPSVKEAKQAEFLMYEGFPWELVQRIGVCSNAVRVRIEEILRSSEHVPPVEVRPDWYF